MPKKSNLGIKKLINVNNTSMKLPIKTILDSVEGLKTLSRLKLPIVLSFKVSKVIKEVDKELQSFDEVKRKRVEELGEEVKDEKGNPTGNFTVTPKNMKAWTKEYKALLENEVELKISKIKISELTEEKIEPFVFAQLDWLIQE